ncbi:hypothetical protein H4582DRAFT_2068927 [Lactarius indigo]|nr:hypothetical protein H4582DRAFT_2068927 [Lactarius indigo]
MASDDDDSSSSRRGPYGSDLEDNEVNSARTSTVSTLLPNLSNQQLHEMLKASQIHQQMLGNELKALRINYEELEEVNKSTKTSRAARGSLEGESREISLAGGRFSVVGELWVKKTTLGIPFPEHLDPLNPSRYNDPAGGSEARGVIAELYRDLKPHLRLALADPDRSMTFKNIFLKQLDQERANSAHAVRAYAPRFFDGLNLSSALFARNFDRTTSLELQKLLGSPAKPGMTYAPFPRLIFPDYDVSSHRPYRSMVLVKFLKLIFYGPSSIDGEAAAKHLTKGVIWGVDSATPGMIAMAATLLTYACSPDQSFSERTLGPSRIPWGQCFNCHKRAILSFPATHRKDLLSWYDKVLFGKDPDSTESSSSDNSGPSTRNGYANDSDITDLVSCLGQAKVHSPAIQPDPLPLTVPRSPSPAPSSGQMERLEPEKVAEANEPQNVRYTVNVRGLISWDMHVDWSSPWTVAPTYTTKSSLPPIPLPTADAEGSTTGRVHKSVNYAEPKLNTRCANLTLTERRRKSHPCLPVDDDEESDGAQADEEPLAGSRVRAGLANIDARRRSAVVTASRWSLPVASQVRLASFQSPSPPLLMALPIPRHYIPYNTASGYTQATTTACV